MQLSSRQTQLSASDSHSQARRNARGAGSSASATSQATTRIPDDAIKQLEGIGRKLLHLCAPWPLWTVFGCWIVLSSAEVVPNEITESDYTGREILSYVPPALHVHFLSLAGQRIVSFPQFTTPPFLADD